MTTAWRGEGISQVSLATFKQHWFVTEAIPGRRKALALENSSGPEKLLIPEVLKSFCHHLQRQEQQNYLRQVEIQLQPINNQRLLMKTDLRTL